MIRAMVLNFRTIPARTTSRTNTCSAMRCWSPPYSTLKNKRNVYLPAGKWYVYETGKEFTGPNTLRIEPSLDVLPLYIRENSILPMGPEILYIGKKNPSTRSRWISGSRRKPNARCMTTTSELTPKKS